MRMVTVTFIISDTQPKPKPVESCKLRIQKQKSRKLVPIATSPVTVRLRAPHSLKEMLYSFDPEIQLAIISLPGWNIMNKWGFLSSHSQ